MRRQRRNRLERSPDFAGGGGPMPAARFSPPALFIAFCKSNTRHVFQKEPGPIQARRVRCQTETVLANGALFPFVNNVLMISKLRKITLFPFYAILSLETAPCLFFRIRGPRFRSTSPSTIVDSSFRVPLILLFWFEPLGVISSSLFRSWILFCRFPSSLR